MPCKEFKTSLIYKRVQVHSLTTFQPNLYRLKASKEHSRDIDDLYLYLYDLAEPSLLRLLPISSLDKHFSLFQRVRRRRIEIKTKQWNGLFYARMRPQFFTLRIVFITILNEKKNTSK